MTPILQKRRRLKEVGLLLSSLFAHKFSFGFFESFYVPGFLINRTLSKRPPIVKKWLIVELTFSNLQVGFLPENQEFKLTSNVAVLILNDTMRFGKISLISSYQYDPNTYQISLKNPRIDTFSFDGLHENAEQLIEKMSPSIGSFFNGYNVYELSSDDIKLLKKTPNTIVIESGGIRFNFN
jgi:hypothetical protein